MIVADAAPVIAFARIGRLALLQRVVEELVVPDAVYDDLGDFSERISPAVGATSVATSALAIAAEAAPTGQPRRRSQLHRKG
jgi:predicted nucleic acid-binding protein